MQTNYSMFFFLQIMSCCPHCEVCEKTSCWRSVLLVHMNVYQHQRSSRSETKLQQLIGREHRSASADARDRYDPSFKRFCTNDLPPITRQVAWALIAET